jgi:hypothetical protein
MRENLAVSEAALKPAAQEAADEAEDGKDGKVLKSEQSEHQARRVHLQCRS